MNRRRDQLGASMVEYVILVSFIALIAVAAVRSFGSAVNESLKSSADDIIAE